MLGFLPDPYSKALRNENFGAIGDWFALLFLVSALLLIVLSGLAAGWTQANVATGVRVLAVSFGVTGASLVCGWVFGLLFGVPRTLARPDDTTQPAASKADGSATSPRDGGRPKTRVNTNLEDISDWLTKTIVGVGLTQLFAIPDAVWRAAKLVNHEGMGWEPYGNLLCLCFFLYNFPGGFWLGYVTTRTILTGLFDAVDRYGASKDVVAQSGDASQLRADRTAGTIRPPSTDALRASDLALLKIPEEELRSDDRRVAYAAAKARDGDPYNAARILKDVVDRNPKDLNAAQQLATVQLVLGQPNYASNTLNRLPINETTVLQALYTPPPEGFERAIEVGEQLLNQPGMGTRASIHVYLACAYGQKHAYLLSTEGSASPALADVVAKVVAETRDAVTLDPTVKDWIHGMWKPKPGSTNIDNDLASIPADNAELKALLE